MIHILPINDEKEHEETTTCWCEPRVEWNDPKTGNAYHTGLVIHNAADCRELIEQAEALTHNNTHYEGEYQGWQMKDNSQTGQ